ncbi:glycosyltransferase family 2 protein [Rhizobium oryzicola]|uniref:Glycosyltransferase family 2 protein n=1 Tax=Rhizobium oryzicola TaxID=1232668 RepID=A0ABT8T4R7_9HYPH|nr:glycosyltransferase family 2 protein [Rhizobium oryzicola]MDO1585586.1 glycosyltransferase family 2 protein [Rhizobium oryzicola]
MRISQIERDGRGGHALITILVPVYNEEEAVEIFLQEVRQHLPMLNLNYEFLFINDGSSDKTLTALLELRQQHNDLRIIDLSRNFGKEAAMTAGLQNAKGDAVIIMDVDLQEPPELIGQMIARWREGYDVVYGRRVRRDSDSSLKRLTASGFYTWFNRIADFKIPDDVGDFRLMDRAVVNALNALPERVRFMKGLFAWVGFRTYAIDFERRERQAGSSKFNYWRLWNFALDGITSFSTIPLRIWTYFGLGIAALAFIYGAFIIGRTLLFGVSVPGYASILTAILFLGGVQLIGLGVLGEYLGRVYMEVKQRPVYLASRIYGASSQLGDHEQAAPHSGRDDQERRAIG